MPDEEEDELDLDDEDEDEDDEDLDDEDDEDIDDLVKGDLIEDIVEAIGQIDSLAEIDTDAHDNVLLTGNDGSQWKLVLQKIE